MLRQRKRIKARLRRLARLRAEGHGWPAIAEQTGWPAKECEALTARHDRLWRRLLRAALKTYVLEGLAEGFAMLRICLRNADARVRRTAATALPHYLRLFPGSRARPHPHALRPEDQQIVEQIRVLKGMSDEQLDGIVDRWVAQRARELKEAAAKLPEAARGEGLEGPNAPADADLPPEPVPAEEAKLPEPVGGDRG